MRKLKSAIKNYEGFKGDQTINALWKSIPDDIKQKLRGWQLGKIMTLLHNAYLSGRASTQAELIDDCVWVGGTIQKMIEIKEVGAEYVKENYKELKEHPQSLGGGSYLSQGIRTKKIKDGQLVATIL